MQIQMVMTLPRKAASVTVARQTASLTLTTAGVSPDCVSAVAVALSEACTNVIHHALASDFYQVTVVLSDGQVTVDVVDSGTARSVGHLRGVGLADPLPEGGRGLELMSALCDRAVIDVGNARGGSVHLMKRLQWREDAPLPTVSAAQASASTASTSRGGDGHEPGGRMGSRPGET